MNFGCETVTTTCLSYVHRGAVPRVTHRGRGRPASTYDNRRIMTFLAEHTSVKALITEFPVMDDILEGTCAAQTSGQSSTRSLSKSRVFRILRSCENIESALVGEAIAKARARDYSPAAVGRYTMAARVASMLMARTLDKHPCWEHEEDNDALLDGLVLDFSGGVAVESEIWRDANCSPL